MRTVALVCDRDRAAALEVNDRLRAARRCFRKRRQNGIAMHRYYFGCSGELWAARLNRINLVCAERLIRVVIVNLKIRSARALWFELVSFGGCNQTVDNRRVATLEDA